MRKTIYYVDNYNHLYDMFQMEQAFTISTGLRRFENEGAYLRWLSNLFGKSIRRVITPTVDDLIRYGEKIKAIKLYHDETGCSLMEAKQFIDEHYYK